MALRSRIRSLCLLAAGLLLATATIEAALRLIAATPLWRVLPVVEVSLYGPDPRTGYTHRADATGIWRSENRAQVNINSQGFRGAALAEAKPADELRIAIVGDSMVEALQVPEMLTFTALLEQRLRGDGYAARVANFGLAGSTVAVQRERVAAHVIPHRPDIVLLIPTLEGFFSAQAADDSAFPAWVPAAKGDLVLRHGFRETAGYRFRQSMIGQVYYTLLDHVQIAGLLNNRKNAGFLPPPIAASSAKAEPCRDAAAHWRQFGNPVGWKRVEAYLADMNELGRAHRFRPVIVFRGLGVDADCAALVAPDRQAALQRFAAQARAQGIPWYDMDMLLDAALLPGDTRSALHGFGHRIGRGHLNPRGHEAYSTILAGIVRPMLP